ncbi:hypothetical protein NSK_002648 [Nannochloropsis salina CCMP1776]|uniref:Uncharacterized protein n=1 Tax=Nannochloropsis salina CCMP1776 TaxID=1027361 RepID=A0A4D9DB17_9STRA|nr:hypothetical protein NSK_002648 [Nannochloropsis salina CCMP1776]|eukprot:TFJ85828.1 hypothetical protein NSK_002648 [Nannochloropsis salina CCMP1776]
MVTPGGAAAATSSSSTSTTSGGSNHSTGHAQAGNASTAAGVKSQARDTWYTFNEHRLEEVMAAKPWSQE